MNIEGKICRLRALEESDVELMYEWENDVAVWSVSGTIAPFSRHTLERFLHEQRFDIYQTRQLRLVVEAKADSRAVGIVDLFDFDPHNRRAGVGILVYNAADRGVGYASDSLAALVAYARDTLGVKQLWCGVEADNAPSLRLFRGAGFADVGLKRQWNWSTEGYKDEVMLQLVF